MAETIYGWDALNARGEILSVKSRHESLLSARGRTRYGSREWDAATVKINDVR